MPSPLTPRKTIKRNDRQIPAKKPPVDIGQSLGAYDSNLIRARIRQWQAQGGGVITAADICVEEEASKDEKEERNLDDERKAQTRSPDKTQVRSGSAPTKPTKDDGRSPTPRKRTGRRKEDTQGDESSRNRSKSAPRKRVVSDQHWRKDRSPLRSAESSKPPTPSNILPDDGIRVRPLPDLSCYTENNSHGGHGSDPRVRRTDDTDGIRVRPLPDLSSYTENGTRGDHGSGPKTRRTIDDDGIRVYSTPSTPKQYSTRQQPSTDDHHTVWSEGREESETESYHTGSAKRRSTVRRSRETMSEESPKSDDKASARRSSTHSKLSTLERSPPSVQEGSLEIEESKRFAKRNIFTQALGTSRKIFSRPEPVIIPPARVPTIESWLSATPDPFAEDVTELPTEISAPLKTTSTRQEAIPKAEVPDTNNIWNALSTEENPRSRKNVKKGRNDGNNSLPTNTSPNLETLRHERHSHMPGAHDLPEEDIREPSFASLRRRGAKRKASSPKRKDSQPQQAPESISEQSGAAALSPSDTASSVEPYEQKAPLPPVGLNIRRPFPGLGRHRLSTIASVDTLHTQSSSTIGTPSDMRSSTYKLRSPVNEDDAASEIRDYFDPSLLRRAGSAKNRLTKHADLISILSVSRADEPSIKSARSIRTNRTKLATATIGDLMNELASDESKYIRELRTLVDGVIPVLLTCMLSKSDSAAAAGLFNPRSTAKDSASLAKPIFDMGIALERLKMLHKRIPLQNKEALLTWAQGAQKVYAEYLKAWRMGFQDVIVNLAPNPESSKPSDLDEGLPRNEDGDVVNIDGERVDVAFLLKRPLVRLKYLAKTFRGVNLIHPSAEAGSLAERYQALVGEARQKASEERARLEDEAATSTDSTRTRDPRTLGPLTGVTLDNTRRVRARDCFDLTLLHSSGQRVDCRVELVLRDDALGGGKGGDLLICELDGTGRWLLFPPIQVGLVSSRNGDSKCEIVVMIRGLQGQGEEWRELLSLKSDDEQTGFDWVQMLGLVPPPPKLMRMQSFVVRQERRKTMTSTPSDTLDAPSMDSYAKSRSPSPRQIEVPIGEEARGSIRRWVDTDVASKERARQYSQIDQGSASVPDPVSVPSSTAVQTPSTNLGSGDKRSVGHARTPRSLDEALRLSERSSSGLQRARAHRRSRYAGDSPASPRSAETGPLSARSQSPEAARPTHLRSRSSAPSLDLPIMPKLRQDSLPTVPSREYSEEPDWAAKQTSSPSIGKKSAGNISEEANTVKESPPAPPVHRSSSPVQLKSSQIPDLRPELLKKTHRRTSSPLKHEYEPSATSDSSSDSEASTVEHNDVSSTSDSSSDDEGLEDDDVAMPLLPLGAVRRPLKQATRVAIVSLPEDTLSPSQSASQAPYKTVPSQPNKAAKTIASIFFWSDEGLWQNLHPDECSIVITPGLIEAHEMSSAHSELEQHEGSSPNGPRPLIGLELTPLVPIRRGTAIDISIRSPPTPDSRITNITNHNFLFRSRNPEECESLYALINHSRINNPTYIALQNARMTSFDTQFSTGLGRNRTHRFSRPLSWFGLGQGRSSYRASSAPSPASVAQTESSIASLSSAFSALRRFTRTGSRFSISRSTVTSRVGSRAGSVYASSDKSSGSGTSTPGMPGIDGNASSAPIGLSNAKIRLYIRETASKWRDLGSARLTIMRPTNASHPLAPDPASWDAGVESVVGGTGVGIGPGGAASPGNRHTENDKRIVVVGKTGEALLDVTLGESCFERVARTGIAVSVWERFQGGQAAKEGGVVGGRLRVFMIQMKSEADTAYTYSIVGRLRH